MSDSQKIGVLSRSSSESQAALPHSRRFPPGLYGTCALVVIVLAMLLRFLLIYLGWPGLNSDEGTMGLMALHIAYRRELPVFFYGQGFMGSLEAYSGAAMFHIFGPSAFALRLGLIPMFALFLACMYYLTSLLYSKQLALFSVVVLALGSIDLLFHELEAAGGYPEILFFGSGILLFSTWLALSAAQRASPRTLKWRMLIYGSWGALAGLGIWSDQLLLAFIFPGSLLLIMFCRRELQRLVVFSLLLGLLLALLPLIIYNVTVPLQQSSLALLGIVFQHDAAGNLVSQPSLGLKIAGTILIGLPNATSVNPLCPLQPQDAWPLSVQPTPHTIQCTIVRGMWGVGFLVLLAVALFLAVRASFNVRRRSPAYMRSSEERQTAIRYVARQMILGSAILTLLAFALSAPAAQTPWPSSRYLIGLLIAIPAVISPLWDTIASARLRPLRLVSIWPAASYGGLFLIILAFLWGTIDTFPELMAVQGSSQQQEALVQDLLHVGATHIYTDYWTCDRIAFQSNEQIVCRVLDEQLQPGYDRYLPYKAVVEADPHPAYVFPLASLQATAFLTKISQASVHYQRFVFDGYVVYRSVT